MDRRGQKRSGYFYKQQREEKLRKAEDSLRGVKKLDTFFKPTECTEKPGSSTTKSDVELLSRELIDNNNSSVCENKSNFASDSFSSKRCEEITEMNAADNMETHILNYDDPGLWPENISDKVRCDIINNGPVQIKEGPFPKSDNKRHFSNVYYERKTGNGQCIHRSYLVYSKSKNSVFCFCCKLFSDQRSSVFVRQKGMSDWQTLSRRLKEHETSEQHFNSFLKWKELQVRFKTNATIDAQEQKLFNKEREKWREVLKRILDCILFLAKNNLPFRGENCTFFTENNGNFLQLIELMAKYDSFLNEHFMKLKDPNHSSNIHYCSPKIQNEFIGLLADTVTLKIINKIKAAVYYSVILDCTPDINKHEQLSLILRYVTIDKENKNVEVQESFIEFVKVTETTGKALSDVLLQRLEAHGLNIDFCRGQCYDNAANMKGKYRGVQSHILAKNTRALYIPCIGHTFNLVICNAAESSQRAKLFFGTTQKVYNTFSGSPKRWEILEKHVKITLKPLSDTRWHSRLDAVKPLFEQLSAVCAALDELSSSTNDTEVCSDSDLLLKTISTFEFILSLKIWLDVLTELNRVTVVVQNKTYDLSLVFPLVKGTQEFLKNYRETGFDSALQIAEKIAGEMGVETCFRAHRVRYKKKMLGENSNDEPHTDARERFRIEYFLTLVETAQQEITERFLALKKFQNLFSFLFNIHSISTDVEQLERSCKALQEHLGEDIIWDELTKEITHVGLFLPKNITSCFDVLQYLVEHDFTIAYPNLSTVLQILLTFPPTVASAERSFSKLKLILTYLRSSMSQDRLCGLSTLSIEREKAEEIDFNDVIRKFASSKARKINLI